jgi:hypothetical protein
VRRLAWALVLCGVLEAPVLAGPPFRTDDPEPVEPGHVELYLSGQGSHTEDGKAGALPLVELNYGVFPEIQFHIVTPWAYAQPSGGDTARGLGDTEVGVKLRLVRETDARPQIGVFPMVELPTGDAGRGLGAGIAQVYLPVWLQKSWGRWTAYGGGGWWWNPGEGKRDWIYTGLLLQRHVFARLAVGGEWFWSSASQVGGRASSGYTMGAVLDMSGKHHLLMSWGKNYQLTLATPRATRQPGA